MTKPGRFGPFELWAAEAVAVGQWMLEEVATSWYTRETVKAQRFCSDQRLRIALVGFANKLRKAGGRAGRDKNEPIAVWRLTPVEAAAAYQYMKLRLLQHIDGLDLLHEDDFATLPFVMLLLGDLFRYAGRPRRTYAEAKRLVEDYESLPSSERVERASGQSLRAARRRLILARKIERSFHRGQKTVQAPLPFRTVKHFIEWGLQWQDIEERTQRLLRAPRSARAR
jgi:hypothetical protein